MENKLKTQVQKIIDAQYCENCMHGIPVEGFGVCCIETSGMPDDWKLPELARPGNPTCDREKYVFDEDMVEYIEYSLVEHEPEEEEKRESDEDLEKRIKDSVDACFELQRECGVTEKDFAEHICCELACNKKCSERQGLEAHH